VVSEPTFHNPLLKVIDDHRLYQRIDDLEQEFQKKLNEAFSRVESCFTGYKYEVQRERQKIALSSLQPPQISLHPHLRVNVPPQKIHSCPSIRQHPPVVKPLFLTKMVPVWLSHFDTSPSWVVIYAWKQVIPFGEGPPKKRIKSIQDIFKFKSTS
jgi:hypothetical protein